MQWKIPPAFKGLKTQKKACCTTLKDKNHIFFPQKEWKLIMEQLSVTQHVPFGAYATRTD